MGEVIDIVMGQAPAGRDCNKEGHGTPFVKTGEFGEERPAIREWTTDPKKIALFTDVLISVVGATCGKINLGTDCAIGRSVAALRPHPQKLDQFFLYHFMKGQVQRLRTGSQGSAQTVISKEMLANTLIPLPPLEEQRRIVAVLDEAFEGLDRARAHAEANILDARKLFESYLADLFTHPDPSWEPTQLSRFCEKITVGHVGPMAKRYAASGTPFLRSQNVRPFKIDLTDVKYIDEAFMNELKTSELRPGDVAIVRTGYPGTCAVVPNDLEVANCADLVIARTGSKLNPHFLALLLNSSYGKKLVAGAAVGAAQKHFNVGAAKRAIFPFPPLETQERMVEQASDLRAATLDLDPTSTVTRRIAGERVC